MKKIKSTKRSRVPNRIKSRLLPIRNIIRKFVRDVKQFVIYKKQKYISIKNTPQKKETVKLQNIVDNQGQMYVGYVKSPMSAGKNKKHQIPSKVIAPENEYKQQVNYNNKGHIPPAYNGIKPPTAIKTGDVKQGAVRMRKKMSLYKNPYKFC
jgi:hypothetical protein